MIIEGKVAPGYEPVKALYERNMARLAERITQLCVYVGEECVVDLWGSAVDDSAFSGDSLVNVFSSGKSLESIALGLLFDRGLLDFDARITDYWPEFGGDGENATTYGLADRFTGVTPCCTANHNQGWPKLVRSLVPSPGSDRKAVASPCICRTWRSTSLKTAFVWPP